MGHGSKTSKKQAWEPFKEMNVTVFGVEGGNQKTEQKFKSLFYSQKGFFTDLLSCKLILRTLLS